MYPKQQSNYFKYFISANILASSDIYWIMPDKGIPSLQNSQSLLRSSASRHPQEFVETDSPIAVFVALPKHFVDRPVVMEIRRLLKDLLQIIWSRILFRLFFLNIYNFIVNNIQILQLNH